MFYSNRNLPQSKIKCISSFTFWIMASLLWCSCFARTPGWCPLLSTHLDALLSVSTLPAPFFAAIQKQKEFFKVHTNKTVYFKEENIVRETRLLIIPGPVWVNEANNIPEVPRHDIGSSPHYPASWYPISGWSPAAVVLHGLLILS